jgi:hypothetical protein
MTSAKQIGVAHVSIDGLPNEVLNGTIKSSLNMDTGSLPAQFDVI